MMPAYSSVDSHPPYKRNQMTFPHYYQVGTDGISPQMNMDPTKPPFAYEQPWPNCYGYPTPMQFCCGHHRFPAQYCTYRPAYPHLPAPSPIYYPGGCPAFAETFYAPYAPPHYTMELPRYEYDKCMPREYHCCGCPNYPLNHKEDRSVKIEEHEPEVEKKVNNATAPSQLRNYPYPFVWIPPEYKVNNPVAAEVDDQDRISQDRKPSEYAKADGQEPKFWNGWFPLDMNSLSNMIQDGSGRRNKNGQIDYTKRESEDGRRNQNQQSDKMGREFLFPIIWLPDYNMQGQDREGTNNLESISTSKSIQEVPHASNSVPVNSCAGGNVSNRADTNGNDLSKGSSDFTSEESNEKNIPLKQIEVQKGESEGGERRVRDIPVKQIAGNMTDKESKPSVKRQSNSPQKTSKLPPVCLRVDPLPRKKNGNGSSRSPSPPASKEHTQATANGTSETFTSSSMHDKLVDGDAKPQNVSNVSGEVKPKGKYIKVMENYSETKNKEQRDGSQSHDQAQVKFQSASNISEEVKLEDKSIKGVEKSSEKKDENRRDGSQSQITSNMNSDVQENSSALTVTKESWTNGEEYKIKENETERKVDSMNNEEARGAKDSTKRTGVEYKKERKALSETEAAVLIEAAYRGFQVRKWEPLKKLKQIAEVSKHVTGVRGSIQALETSPDFQNDERERIKIGETIMRLLLKLDTIQGLHPSFREMRKSLARELTSLQEKLDSVMAKKSKQQMEELSARKFVGDTLLVAPNGELMQEQSKEKVLEPGKDFSEGSIHESRDMLEQQPEEKAAAPGKDYSDGKIHVSQDTIEQCQDQLSLNGGNSTHEDEKLHSVVHSLPGDDDKCKSSSPVDLLCNEETGPLPKEMDNKDISHVNAVDASGNGIFDVANNTKSEEDIPIKVEDLDMKAWKELPQGVLDELDVADIDFGKEKKNKIEGEELQVSGVTTTPEDRHIPAMTDDFTQDGASSQIHEMAELPVGVLDDVTASFEFEKRDETEILDHVPQNEEGECNAGLKTNSSIDDIPKETQLDQQQQRLEEQEEEQSTEESDGWVKIESQEDELKGNASLHAEVESHSREEIEQQSVTTEFTGNDGHEVAHEDAYLAVKEVPVETPEEEVALEDVQSEREDIVVEQGINADAENKETLAEQTVEHSKELPIPEHDGLIEENEKLRKMMQKLLEAGNEQLTVISNLTGRVRDLEKKLARKKRVRTRRCRPATSKPSCKKLQGKAIGVAM